MHAADLSWEDEESLIEFALTGSKVKGARSQDLGNTGDRRDF
jgi:hypothetical protein